MRYRVEQISRSNAIHPYEQWCITERRETPTGVHWLAWPVYSPMRRFDSPEAAQKKCDTLNKVKPCCA